MADVRFDSILVATDLSQASRAAYGHAVAFARAFEASVSLLFVDEDDDSPSDLTTAPAVAAQRTAQTAAREAELAAVVANFSDLGITVHVERAKGKADRAILERSESDACDIVIIAKHGVRESNPGIMGSTAERVMHHADVPVVIAYDAAPAFGTVAAYQRFAVSTDHSDDSLLGIARIVALAERFDAQVDVVHAISVPTEVSGKWRRDYVQAQLEHLQERLAAGIPSPRAQGRIQSGLRVPETVIAGALETAADLLCVPTHGKGALRRALFGSIADRVMRLAPLPAMIMPRKWLRE